MTTADGAATGTPIGVYRGANPDIVPVQAYEAFLGMSTPIAPGSGPAGDTIEGNPPSRSTVDYVLSFVADAPSWADFERAALQNGTNAPAGSHSASGWAPLLGPRKLMLAVPACVQGTSWADEASGKNDAHWAVLARNLVSAGLGGCVLRIAREFSGGWYPWSVNPGNGAAHKTGWARIVNTMRSAGFTGKFMWNPYLGQGTFQSAKTDPTSVYPGNATVDVIGLDFYDFGYMGPDGKPQTFYEPRSIAQKQAAWNTIRDQWAGLTGWHAFSQNTGRPLAYPEWGLQLWMSGNFYEGGGDNALLIEEMAAWIRFSNPWMQAHWEDPGVGVADPDDHPRRIVAVPEARAAFLAGFGYAGA